MRVLTSGLDEELARLLGKRWVSKVDIATAWATEGRALDALVSTKRQLRVRTLAGFAGNHTTPGALKRLAKLGPVRLVDSNAGLFHVKLFLFRGSRRSLAWVGSANFTGPGFGRNEELLYETEDTDELQDWFNRRWKEIGSQPNQPAAYCREWERNDAPMLGVNDDGATVIILEQKGARPPERVQGGSGRRNASRGWVTIGSDRYSYTSAQNCLKVVFDVLQQKDPSFLRQCRRHRDFRRDQTRHVARNPQGLGTAAHRKDPTLMGSGWWLSSQTQTQEKWAMILAAAKIAGMSVEHGDMWQAEGEGIAQTEVGF